MKRERIIKSLVILDNSLLTLGSIEFIFGLLLVATNPFISVLNISISSCCFIWSRNVVERINILKEGEI
jgi:hypothetical protein